jgi:hypothetical protein
MATPMIDDFELAAVQQIRQETDQDFGRQHALGLDGTLHQKLGRRSHRVWLWGYLLPDSAADDLKKLQEKASQGEEVTFTADIVAALEVEKMVIESFQAEQRVGPAGQTAYAITLAEAPPLPPPAETSSFGGLGGLDGFGIGDLGFDTDALGDVVSGIEDQAGSVMDMADKALDAVQQLGALANLGDLANIGNPLTPVTDKVGELGNLQQPVQDLAGAAGEIQP